MAIKTNMAKAKQKHEEEKDRAARQASFGRRTTWWKPIANKSNKIRILPPWTDAGPNAAQFWREVWMHYGVTSLEAPDEDNTFAVPCARKSPDGADVVGGGDQPDCKICQAAEELKATGNPVDVQLSKELRAKMRVYINMVDLADPVWVQDAIDQMKADGCPEDHLPKDGEPKVQVFNFGPQIFKMLLDQYSDDVDLADLDEGHDVVIEREGEGLKTKYRVRAQVRSTAAPIKDEQLDDGMWNLDTLVPYFSDEQQQMILDGGSKETVYGLFQPTETDENKQLAESTEETSEEPADEEPADEAAEGSLTAEAIPVDSDGDIIFDDLTDEQIEDPANASLMITNKEGTEYGPHVTCFGDEKEHNPKDKACRDDCFLFERCGKRIAFKEEAAKKAAAAAKKGPGKGPGKGAPKAGKGNGAAAAKPKAGKPKAGKAAKPAEPAPAGNPDELEAEMMAAMNKGKG